MGIFGIAAGPCEGSGGEEENEDVSEVLVLQPNSPSIPSGQTQTPLGGKAGETIVAELRGKYYTANYYNQLYGFNVTAVTVPVIASGLVSVFSIYNPPNSGVIAEMVDTELGMVLATTVVDVVGWYFQAQPTAAAATFTTAATIRTFNVGQNAANKVLGYTALTHSGTPTRIDLIGSFGAVTNANSSLPAKIYDGRLLLFPGTLISVAMSTAAGTGSGLDISARWIEWPM